MVLKVVSAPARFWERGARCFAGRLCVLERLVAICSIFWRIDYSGFKNFQERYRRTIYAVRVAVNRFFLRSGWFEMPCQAMGAGRAARGDRKLGVNGCREALWSEELERQELRGLEPRGCPVFWTSSTHPHSLTTNVVHADSKGGVAAQTRFRKFEFF